MIKHEKNYLKPTAEGQPTVGRKAKRNPSDDEQKLHTRPSGWDELAQHSEVPSFSPAGKWSVWAGEVLTPYPGRPASGTPEAGVSRGHSSDPKSRELSVARLNIETGKLWRGRMNLLS